MSHLDSSPNLFANSSFSSTQSLPKGQPNFRLWMHIPLLLAAACGPTGDSPLADGGIKNSDSKSPSSLIDAKSPDMVADASAPAIDAALGIDAAPVETRDFVYYYGDFDSKDIYQVARIDLDNKEKEILALADFAGAASISGIALNPDSQRIYIAGKSATGNAPEIQSFSADGSGAGSLLFRTDNSAHSISALKMSPDGNWLAFLADFDLIRSKALYVVPTDASLPPKRVSLAPLSSSQDVLSYRWAPNSTHLAFVGDLLTNNTDALWTVDITTNTPAPLSIVSSAELGSRDVGRIIDFDQNNQLYFMADFELRDNQYRLYRCALDGTGRAQLLGTALNNNNGEASVGSFSISPQGSQLVFASEAPNADLYQVYRLDLSSSAPTMISNLNMGASGSSTRGPNFYESIAWSPDGLALSLSADWSIAGQDVNNDFGAFVLPTTEVPGGVGITKATVGNGDVFAPQFSPDSTQIIFLGDLLENNHNDLYMASDLQSENQAPADLILQQAVSGGHVRGFVLSAL